MRRVELRERETLRRKVKSNVNRNKTKINSISKSNAVQSAPSQGTNGSIAASWNPDEEYEVEAIRDVIRKPDGTLSVLVKWKNWPETTNSWVSLMDTKCYEAIVKFLTMTSDKKYIPHVMLQYMQEKFSSPKANVFIICKLLSLNFNLKKCLLLDYLEKTRLREIVRQFNYDELSYSIKKHYGDFLSFVQLVDSLENISDTLDVVRQNVIRGSQREAMVYFENLIDDTQPDLMFILIQDYSFASNITPAGNNGGCLCQSCEICSCAIILNNKVAHKINYTADGGLSEQARNDPSAIVECGPLCVCPRDCPNRVTQRGRLVEVTVYKTDDGKGWGLRTNSPIQAWSFVLDYLGEVKKFNKFEENDSDYIFELGNERNEPPKYVVDSTVYANIARFINHSCDPNLSVVKVLNKHRDPEIPRIALFSCRDIAENEELTFDYRSMKLQASEFGGLGFKCCCQENGCVEFSRGCDENNNSFSSKDFDA